LPYAYPPKQIKKDILGISFDEFFQILNKSKDETFKTLNDNFFGISQTFAKQVCSKCKDEKELFTKLQEYLSLKNIFPAISFDWSEFSLYEDLLGEGILVKDVNEMIDKYFAHHQEVENIKVLKSKLSLNINGKLKKVKNSLEKVQKQSNVFEKADFYRKNGDLIMANLFQNKDFSQSAEVFDYDANSPLKIKLDETKTLKENASRYYKLYNKAKTTGLKSQEMMESLQLEKNYLEQILYSINQAQTVFDLLEIQEETGNEKRETRLPSSITSHSSLPFTLQVPSFTIYVGKNNKQNDYIVSKLARDEDLWFHVNNCAGSHVLLKSENNVEPDDKIIFECAKLAKENSSAKDSSKVGVIYTKRKFLKKPPGANLGYVTYKKEKEIIV